MSFDEWSSCGYRIKKGEKSRSVDALGIPQFLLSQVWKAPSKKQQAWLKKMLSMTDEQKAKAVKRAKKKQAKQRRSHMLTALDMLDEPH